MQRCVTSQRYFGTIDQEYSGIAEWRLSRVANLGARQEAKLHQSPGITLWQVNGVNNTLLAQP